MRFRHLCWACIVAALLALSLSFPAYADRLQDILDRPDPFGLPEGLQLASPVAAVVLGLLAAWAWRTGVRRYRSTGS